MYTMFEFQTYSQTDPTWKNKLLGFSDDTTIGKYGCLLACLSMVSSSYRYDVQPDVLNEKLKSLGPNVGFQGALVIPASLPRALPKMIYQNFMWCRDFPAPLKDINSTLDAGKSVIVELDYSPAAGLQNHWVVLYGRKDNDYLLRDPWPFPSESDDVLLSESRFAFAGPPGNIITGALWLDGITSKITEPKPEVGEDEFVIFANADGLALRTQPFISQTTLIKRLPLDSKLQVLESADDANQKIGAVNQWIHVIDEDGIQGFVAAWYTTLTESTIVGSEPEPQVEIEPAIDIGRGPDFILQASVDELALRSEPIISEETLLKRLPFDAELLVLDDIKESRAKVGAVGEWIKIRDIDGDVGYVAAWYVSTEKHPPLGPKPDPGSFVIRTTAEYLALRSEPVVRDDSLIKRLPINAELVVLEPASEARLKVGIFNKWLRVRDITNTEGYVAAWYVDIRPGLNE
jgi:hypothetical protein